MERETLLYIRNEQWGEIIEQKKEKEKKNNRQKSKHKPQNKSAEQCLVWIENINIVCLSLMLVCPTKIQINNEWISHLIIRRKNRTCDDKNTQNYNTYMHHQHHHYNNNDIPNSFERRRKICSLSIQQLVYFEMNNRWWTIDSKYEFPILSL